MNIPKFFWIFNSVTLGDAPGHLNILKDIRIFKFEYPELFLPWQNSTCELPALPDERYGHVQSGDMLCGGEYTERSCLKWSVEQGGWATLTITLTEKRWGSSVWRVSQDSLVIMGGLYDAAETSETVSSDGDSTRNTFYMKYPTW